jgi:hypothetical protein
MKLQLSFSIRKITTVLTGIALALAIISITGKYIEAAAGLEAPHLFSQLVRLFNINRESSIPTWYASTLLFMAAVLLALVAWQKQAQQAPYVRHWRGLALIFLYISIDEAAAIHERFTEPMQSLFETSGPFYFAWVLVGIPLVLLFAAFYLRFWWNLPPRIRTLFFVAGAVYVGGALGVEMIGSSVWYYSGGTSLIYSSIGTVEEFMEMMGIVVLIYTVFTYVTNGNDTFRLSVEPVDSSGLA